MDYFEIATGILALVLWGIFIALCLKCLFTKDSYQKEPTDGTNI